jgi:hypothetical protein
VKKMKIREFPSWPPEPGGATTSSYRSPASDQAILTRVVPKQVDGWVTFVGDFEGNDFSYDFNAPNERLAETVREALRKNLGTSVFGLGDLVVEVEPETNNRSVA